MQLRRRAKLRLPRKLDQLESAAHTAAVALQCSANSACETPEIQKPKRLKRECIHQNQLGKNAIGFNHTCTVVSHNERSEAAQFPICNVSSTSKSQTGHIPRVTLEFWICFQVTGVLDSEITQAMHGQVSARLSIASAVRTAATTAAAGLLGLPAAAVGLGCRGTFG